MTEIKIGSSIKTYTKAGKEKFLTVESLSGDIGLFQRGKLFAKRKRNNNLFTYNFKTYKII